MNAAMRFHHKRPELLQLARRVIHRFAGSRPGIACPIDCESVLDVLRLSRIKPAECLQRILGRSQTLRRAHEKRARGFDLFRYSPDLLEGGFACQKGERA